MKVILAEKNQFILRFDKGDEVIAEIKEFMQAQAIRACVFNGIGACGDIELFYYNPSTKKYESKVFTEDLEVLSLSGNGGMKDDQPILHIHGVFGRNDFTTIGGHVAKLVVSVTCEVFMTKLEGEMQREQNQDFNLNLLV